MVRMGRASTKGLWLAAQLAKELALQQQPEEHFFGPQQGTGSTYATQSCSSSARKQYVRLSETHRASLL